MRKDEIHKFALDSFNRTQAITCPDGEKVNYCVMFGSYWYHPDHLGSSSWITYSNGETVQHLYYLPWGEDFVDQRTTSWHALFAFSAKERDTETGLSYFGARYYSSDLSIWLAVDPMSDKYPSMSPYVYCADNPVRLVDPEGEDWYENENGKMCFTDKYTSAADFARSGIKGTYKGKTYEKNGVYYSLFGSTLDSKVLSSNQIKLTKKIDEAFIKYAAYNKKCERSTGEYPAMNASDYTDFNDIIPFVDRFGTTDENQHDWDPKTKKDFWYACNSKFRFTVVGHRSKMFGHFYGFSTENSRKDFGTGNIGYHLYIVNGKNKIIGLTFNKKENVEAFHNLYNALFK